MTTVLDHVFVLCSVGGPEAAGLARLGYYEGSPNTHPGQGTANRRFFFRNAYLELLWVCDEDEAQSEPARRTRLFERWSQRSAGACPFGIVLRPAAATPQAEAPFPTWAYRPAYLEPPNDLDVALDVPLAEPALFYVAFARPRGSAAGEPAAHGIPVGDVTAVTIDGPAASPRSAAAEAITALGLVTYRPAKSWVLHLVFDGGKSGQLEDMRPELPLTLRW